jgi:hypothetical protein
MKFIISVLALITLASTGHHTDHFGEGELTLLPEEKRHPLIPDHNYVSSLNSKFLFNMYEELHKIYWRREADTSSFHLPHQKTD